MSSKYNRELEPMQLDRKLLRSVFNFTSLLLVFPEWTAKIIKRWNDCDIIVKWDVNIKPLVVQFSS